MKLNSLFKSLISIVFLASAGQANAGKEGVSYYYGVGGGAMSFDEKSLAPDPDWDLGVPPYGAVFVGLEEDGWALEVQGFRSLDTDIDNTVVEYFVTGTIASLGYRTIERNRSYYIFNYGKVSSDFKIRDKEDDTTETVPLDGSVYSIGWGKRLQSKNRLEIQYSLFNPKSSEDQDIISKVHMLTVRYMFGGSSPSEK